MANVITYGTFDLFYVGHLRLLQWARSVMRNVSLPWGLTPLYSGDILHLPLNTERIEKLTENSFVENATLKAALGWQKMPIAAEEGMRLTLKSFQSPFPPAAFPNSPPNLSQI